MTVARGRFVAVAVYLTVAGLVAGGLGWATRQALQLEHADTIRLALWRLDSRIFPVRAREDNRPVSHYEPLYPPVPALNRRGQQVPLGEVLVPSPLLDAELPDWMSIHFVVDPKYGWRSPQVPSDSLMERLKSTPAGVSIINATPERRQRLLDLSNQFPPAVWFGPAPTPVTFQQQEIWEGGGRSRAPAQTQQAGQWLEAESQVRKDTQLALSNEIKKYDSANIANVFNRNPADLLFKDAIANATFSCTSGCIDEMKPEWRRGRNGVQYLLLCRKVESDGQTFFQGVAFDWLKLRAVLLEQIKDLLPAAHLEPAMGETDRAYSMEALPVTLSAGDVPMTMFPLNTPLRWGLVLAWAASLLGLFVVALSGWSLLDLSERRFRFVTAVTHELRTPLTTLRLYLDMLTGGMVREPKQRDEYLQTLHGEADRLHRLIGNVLDFARLERQRPQLNCQPLSLMELIDTVQSDWEDHCKKAGKTLIVEIGDHLPVEIKSDPDLCRQLIGNLIDNSCKYSAGSPDARVWLRVIPEGKNVVFEVEDRGPGVSGRESRSVFRAFHRGKSAPTTAGGVGLGLALANRWAKLLGGQLSLKSCDRGACFQFIHPLS